MIDIFIIIPVHNRVDFTRGCLAALKNQRAKDFAVIVIDDGSTDGTAEMIKKDFPDVILLSGNGSLWWSGATNVGIKEALHRGCRWILTLNDDTVPEPDFITAMSFWAKEKPTSLLGAFAIDIETKAPVYGGERINWLTASYTSLLNILDREQWKGIHPVTHFPGRGLLIPSFIFDKIGLFAADIFPQSGADDDFTHRAIRAGFPVYCNYDARLNIYPHESGDAKIRNDRSIVNYGRHLFGFKGGGNIVRFVRYAIRNAPKKFLIPFLFCGLTRRIVGYPLFWLMQYIRPRRKEVGRL